MLSSNSEIVLQQPIILFDTNKEQAVNDIIALALAEGLATSGQFVETSELCLKLSKEVSLPREEFYGLLKQIGSNLILNYGADTERRFYLALAHCFLELKKLPEKDLIRDFIRDEGRRMKVSGRFDDAENLEREFSNKLLTYNHIGDAADLISEAAKWFNEKGQVDKGANLMEEFANSLFARYQYGWAASRYYDAAMMYIERGIVPEARRILDSAYTKFNNTAEKYWITLFDRHRTILAGDGDMRANIATMQVDFKRDNQYSWVESCEIGIRTLASKRQG